MKTEDCPKQKCNRRECNGTFCRVLHTEQVDYEKEQALRRDAQMQEWPAGKPAYKPEE